MFLQNKLRKLGPEDHFYIKSKSQHLRQHKRLDK
nr:MAG TPA: hypothetical protein [Caudoviricetes sp.]